jgi:hypothetical protein
LLLLIASRVKSAMIAHDGSDVGTNPAVAIASIFLRLAEATGNREHVRIVSQLNDRLAPYRHVEPKLLTSFGEELAELMSATEASTRSGLSRVLRKYHKRRITSASRILAALVSC